VPDRFRPESSVEKERKSVSHLQSFVDQVQQQLVLLAPAGSVVPDSFERRQVDPDQHARWLRQAQSVRGGIYLADGALDPSKLTADGRHVQRADYDSWHLLAVDANGEVHGCARYRHLTGDVSFDDLGVSDSWLARSRQWGASLKGAVESEMVRAKRRGTAFSEVGGWALVPEKRCTTKALRIATATFSLAQTLGGCVGISTATERHRSSSILRRIGGCSLEYDGAELPSYYDPQYRCQMEVLRFDSNSPDASCRKWVQQMSEQLAEVPVVAAREPIGTRPAQAPRPAAVTWPSLPQLEWVT
jgi:hypothetical protein